MFHKISFSEIIAMRRNRQPGQKRFLQFAHSIEKTIQQELRSFACAVWAADCHPGFLQARRYRLRKEIRPGQAIWWIEKDIPPADRYRCAAYLIQLQSTTAGEDKLFFQSGLRKYPIHLNNLSGIHDTLSQASKDPALMIPRRMGAALDP